MERQASMRILYVGWVGYGNLGDDLCRDLFIHHVREALGPRGIEAEIRTASHRGISKEALLEFHPHLVVLGAGSLMTLHYLQPIILAQAHGIPTITWGTGFDKLSKQHLYELLMGARRLSFWQDQGLADTFRRAVDGCRWAGVRGPHTLRLLQAAGCASPTLHVSGDPGLCLEPPSTPEELPPGLSDSSEWAGALEWLSAHDAVVGVNWGTANNHVFGGEELGVQRGLEAVMTRLLRRSYKILLFAVWGPDLSPLRRLAARFQSEPGVRLLRRVPPGPLLAWMLRRCRFTINFKLHANVFTAAAGRPFVSLAYRSKCYDFAASLGLERLVVPFDQPDLPDAVLSACDTIERREQTIVRGIQKHKRQYRSRLQALIHHIAALSEEEF
ncbi:MAG TPA: polysaccharide pyruvyl transferase family protein [Limnochordia bacterium]|nr:polysaccharide pyruvyl transferase family protein [Limnochordia bacterium]